MGAIQQGINQLLGTAAIAARLSPELETKRELKESEKNFKSVVKQNKAIHEVIGEVPEEQLPKLQSELEKQFELDPTSERYEKTQTIPNYIKNKAKLKEEEDRKLQAEAEAQQADYEAQQAEYERGQLRARKKARKQLKQKLKHEKFKEMFTEGGIYK